MSSTSSYAYSKGNIFEKFDIFGNLVNLRFNNTESHKTLYGAIGTVVILGVLMFEIFYVLLDLLNYANVSVIFEEKVVTVPKQVMINPVTFPFAISVLSNNLVYVNDTSVVYLEAVFQVTNNVFNSTTGQYQFVTTSQSVNLVQCTPDHFQLESVRSYFLSLPYSSLYCFDPTQTFLQLQGQYGAEIYKRIRIQAKECVTGSNCKSKSYRDSMLNDGQLQIFYTSYAMSVTNRTDPFQSFGQSLFWKQSSNGLNNINVYFRNAFLQSTEGYLGTDVKNHNELLYSFDRSSTTAQLDNTVYELYLNLEKNKESYYFRKYLTLTEAFSQIGGLFNFLLCIGALFFRPISKMIYKQKLLNQMFSYKSEEQEKSFGKYEKTPASPEILMSQNLFSTEDIARKPSNKSDLKLNHSNRKRNTDSLYKLTASQTIRPADASQLESNFQIYLKGKIGGKLQKQTSNLSDSVQFEKKEEEPIPQVSSIRQVTRQTQLVQNNLLQSLRKKDQVLTSGRMSNENPDKQEEIEYEDTQKQTSQFPKDFIKGSQLDTIRAKQSSGEKKQVKYLEQLFKKQDTSNYVSFVDVIRSMLASTILRIFPFWEMSPKSKMIKYALSQMHQHLDINYIIDKLLEIEKLKKLLLNQEQIRLFNLIPQPNICEKDFIESKETETQLEKSHIFLMKNKNLEEKVTDAQDAFDQIISEGKEKESLSKVNRKLLELLDPKLLGFLGQNSNYTKISQTQAEEALINFVADESEFNEEFKTPKPFITQPNSPNCKEKFQLN